MSDGTLQTLDVTMLEDVGTGANQIVQLDSNAKIPACSAAAVTNLPSITKSSSDPTISTNPSGGVGTVYQNTTSGEMYICTDATAGANVWINVGAGTGDIEPYYYGGASYGYVAGGTGPPSYLTSIDKVSFASDGNATSLSSKLTRGFVDGGDQGAQSDIAGYYVGGQKSSGPNAPYSTDMEKFIFATEAQATDIGDLTVGRALNSGQNSDTRGYCAGGTTSSPVMNTIDSWLFASDGNATDWGDLTAVKRGCGSASYGTSYGFTLGGEAPGTSQIDRYAFSSASNATDFGDLTRNRSLVSSASSQTHGYSAGGDATNNIERFAFASPGNAVDVGDLVGGTFGGGSAGLSSTTHGYFTGSTRIEKYTFASATTNSTDVGDLTVVRGGSKGTHV